MGCQNENQMGNAAEKTVEEKKTENKQKVIITVSRQYCSGGLKVGKRLAEELGICCYDSEMFRLVSDDRAMTDNEVAHDARIKDTSLFDVAKKTYDERPGMNLRRMMSFCSCGTFSATSRISSAGLRRRRAA